MKHLLAIITLCTMVLLTSCGHNMNLSGVGTFFRIGNAEANLLYADGLIASAATRENTSIQFDIDSNAGFSFDPTTNTYKGVKSMRIICGPQATGYYVDLAEKSPEAAAAYSASVVEYYKAINSKASVEAQKEVAQGKSEASNASFSGIIDAVKSAIAKYKPAGSEETAAIDNYAACEAQGWSVKSSMIEGEKHITVCIDGGCHEFIDPCDGTGCWIDSISGDKVCDAVAWLKARTEAK